MDENKIPATEIVMYQSENGETKIDVQLDHETVWLTREQMAILFKRERSVIGKHIRNIFEEGELEQNQVWAKFAHTADDGKTYQVDYYNLDVIISVGYRVKSKQGTQFRIWALNILKEYIIKGFAMNDDLLKKVGGGNYFDELLERIRDIRSSEKVFYRKVLDIYATSVDYESNSDTSKKFFQTIQNKMHWAAHGQTAAEKIYFNVDSEKPYMGLQSYTGKQIVQADVLIAKNYCSAEEITALNGIVSAYLEFAEMQASRHIPMYMNDWIQTLDGFLSLARHEILTHAGSISAAMAEKKAKDEYRKYKKKQNDVLNSVDQDFLRIVSTIKNNLA